MTNFIVAVTTLSTSDWQYYSNSSYNFYLKYPRNWYLRKSIDETEEQVANDNIDTTWNSPDLHNFVITPVSPKKSSDANSGKNGNHTNEGLIVNFGNNQQAYTAEDYAKKVVIPSSNKTYQNQLKVSSLIVNGFDAAVIDDQGGQPSKDIIISAEGKIFSFFYYLGGDNNDIYNSIIYTLKTAPDIIINGIIFNYDPDNLSAEEASSLFKEIASSPEVQMVLHKDDQEYGNNQTLLSVVSKHQNSIIELDKHHQLDASGDRVWVQKVNGQWKVIQDGGQEGPICKIVEDAGIEPGVDCIDDQTKSLRKTH